MGQDRYWYRDWYTDWRARGAIAALHIVEHRACFRLGVDPEFAHQEPGEVIGSRQRLVLTPVPGVERNRDPVPVLSQGVERSQLIDSGQRQILVPHKIRLLDEGFAELACRHLQAGALLGDPFLKTFLIDVEAREKIARQQLGRTGEIISGSGTRKRDEV